MKVILYNEGQYLKAHREFIRAGGPRKLAADKASRIRQNLEADVAAGVPTTHHGEGRISHAIKYDLGDGYRLVTYQDSGVCFLLYMGDHDSTQRWLENNRGLRITVNSETRQVTLVNDIADTRPEDMPAATPTLDERPYLARITNAAWSEIIKNEAICTILMQYGEDSAETLLWPMISLLQREDPKAAQLVQTVLRHLKQGENQSAEAAVDLYLGRANATPEIAPARLLTEDVLKSDANADRIIVLNDISPAEWERLLDPSRFQEFMVWLHPGQKRVVDEDFSGPAILTGVSGSGKTCVLVHRARRMARMYPDDRILVLTLNHSLAGLIKNLITRLCLEGEEKRIDVLAFHDFMCRVLSAMDLSEILETLSLMDLSDAVQTLRKTQRPTALDDLFRYRDERDLIDLFTGYLKGANRELRDTADRLQIYVFGQEQGVDLEHYLYEELELVRSAFCGYENGYKEYLNYARTGRSIQFQDKRRDAVIQILKGWEHYQIAHGFLDHMSLSQVVALMLDLNHGSEFPPIFKYRCLLVDEFQDFSTTDMKVLLRVAKSPENGLFLTGDFAQKMFTKELDLPRIGLGPEHRTMRSIRKNYRNSRQILQAAHQLIVQYEPDLPPADRGNILSPEYAVRDSAQPIALLTDDPVQEAWHEAEDWLRAGNIQFSVCLVTVDPKTYPVRTIVDAKPDGVEVAELTGDYFLQPEKVVVSDLASIKGFEFSLVILIGLDHGVFPSPGRPSKEVWRDAMRLYVAITRGRDEVRFLYSGAPSRLLTAMDPHISWRKAMALPTPDTEVPSKASNLTPKVAKRPMAAAVPPPVESRIHVINGVPVVDLSSPVSQRSLAVALGKPLREIGIACMQAADHYTSGTAPMRDHVVRKIASYFGCVANIIQNNTVPMDSNPNDSG